MEQSKLDEQIKNTVVKSLEDSKANNLVCLNIGNKTDICTYFIICSGTSDTHVKSLADKLTRDVKKNKIKVYGSEGQDSSNWVVVDLGAVIVHIFKEEVRRYYNLETMWED